MAFKVRHRFRGLSESWHVSKTESGGHEFVTHHWSAVLRAQRLPTKDPADRATVVCLAGLKGL